SWNEWFAIGWRRQTFGPLTRSVIDLSRQRDLRLSVDGLRRTLMLLTVTFAVEVVVLPEVLRVSAVTRIGPSIRVLVSNMSENGDVGETPRETPSTRSSIEARSASSSFARIWIIP